MSWWLLWQLVEWTLRLLMIWLVLRRHRTPVVSLAWLSLAFFVPELGVLLYGLLGGSRLGRRRVKRYRRVMANVRSASRLAGQRLHITKPNIEPELRSLALQAQNIGGFGILGGNQVELLGDSPQTVRRLIEDMDRAQHHIHLLFYIFDCDATGRSVAEAVKRAVNRGVACRILADASGSRGFFKKGHLADELRAAGAQVLAALPVAPIRHKLARLDLRNHRKLAIIDGSVAYSGSQNLVDPSYGHKGVSWVDLMGRFTGPLVSQLQIVFLEDWTFETGQELVSPDILPSLGPMGDIAAQAIPTGPTHDAETLPRVILAAINAAQRHIIITSPYLVPDEPVVLALSMAAARGVQVDLVLPKQSDHPVVCAAGRAYFGPLMDEGVRIHLYEKGLLHAKTMTVDDSFALLGSSNLDIRSFYLNFELNVLLFGSPVTRRLRQQQQQYIVDSQPLSMQLWAERPWWQRYAQSAAALASPLL